MKSSIFSLAALLLLFGKTGHARADFITAVDYNSGIESNSTTTSTTLGYGFTVGSSSVTIDALGLEIAAFNEASPGTVRIYQDGTTTNLASAAITAMDPLSTTDPNFRYVTLGTPLTLNANTKYDIVADLAVHQGVITNALGITTVSGITFDNAVEGASGTFPTTDGTGDGPYFGPSFEIASVPEPSSFILLGLCLAVAFCAWRLNRRRKLAAATVLQR